MVAKNTSEELILFTIIDAMLSNIHERDSENAMSDINSIILTLGPVQRYHPHPRMVRNQQHRYGPRPEQVVVYFV
nr:hypothetical protein Iba_chr03cCG1420 [Ipomoea batatas]